MHPTLLDPVVARAATTLSVPRREPADSFVLHASLELLARVGLLPFVHAEQREAARERITGLAAEFAAAGDPVEPPPTRHFDSVPEAATRLGDALAAGDLDEVDAVAAWLGDRASPAELSELLGEAVAPALAAAGHAPIGLFLLHRVGIGDGGGHLLRGPLRELARHPQWRIDWFDGLPDAASPASLFDALAAVPHLGRPGSDFIYPLMRQVQSSGVASRLFAPVLTSRPDVASATRTITRVAAWSMLHDDAAQAPYGWTHCLTMPQAVMALAGRGVAPRTAVAVAATHVAGFRAAHGTVPFRQIDVPAGAVPEVADVATYAALHHDAHLVKYTLACLHAADDDPAMRGMYLHAAGFLGDWWRAAG